MSVWASKHFRAAGQQRHSNLDRQQGPPAVCMAVIDANTGGHRGWSGLAYDGSKLENVLTDLRGSLKSDPIVGTGRGGRSLC